MEISGKDYLAKKFCKPSSPGQECAVMGYLQSDPDHQTGKTNEFIVCKKIDINKGTWEVDIRSNNLTETSMTSEKFREKATSAQEGYFTWGSPFSPGKGDSRVTEYRFYHDNGEPKKIEIYTVKRDESGKTLEPKTLSIDWPQ